jgi:hypothetical protein
MFFATRLCIVTLLCFGAAMLPPKRAAGARIDLDRTAIPGS